MRKILGFIWMLAGILCISGCSMKECKCLSSNQVMQNDSLIRIEVDTVKNVTRNSCEDFNVDEVMTMDSTITIHHVLICQEN